jgi:hypothetical protein
MAAKAKLIEFLAAGLEDTNGNPLSGYKVRTYAADGTTAKVVWEDRDKTLPTAAGKADFTLSATGRAVVYADGVYVIKVWTSTADPDIDSPYKTYPASNFKDEDNLSAVLTAQVASLTALKAFDRQSVVEAVYMRSRSTPGDGGHGWFRWDASDLSAEVAADILSGIYVAPTGQDGSLGAWVRQYSGAVNVRWFGAVGNGVADSFPALQAAHNAGISVFYPAGSYITSGAIAVTKGQKAFGENGGRFSNNTSKITSSASNTPIFTQTTSASTGQEDGFSAEKLYLVSDIGIRLNDETITIVTGGAQPYLMRPIFRDMTFQAKTNGTGTGLIMSKTFDFIVEGNEFIHFARHLVMQGCDIGRVKTNRFVWMHEYGILELSTAETYGSQTIIENNDMVMGGSPAAVFIKTTGRHVRIKNNYLEQHTSNVKGFIDISASGVPQYGSNVVASTRLGSVEVDGNRIDGHSYVTDFIYRYESGYSLFTKIHDVGTVGPAPLAGVGTWLKVEGAGLTARRPGAFVNYAKYDIYGGRANDGFDYNFFRTKPITRHGGSVTIDAESLVDLRRNELGRNNAIDHVRLSNKGIIILPTLGTTLFHAVLPVQDGLNNPWLRDGVTYTAKIIARTVAGTEDLRVFKVVNAGTVGAPVLTTVDTQAQVISFAFTGALSTDTIGLAFSNQSEIPTNNIVLESITFAIP